MVSGQVPSSFDFVTKSELAEWVKHPKFATYFPTWVEGLVRAEAGGVLLSCDFATEEDAARHGYDGTSNASEARENVPEGWAYWELGKDVDVRKKAKIEYKRVAEALGEDARSYTFIFVTPRAFPQRRKDAGSPFDEKSRQDWERARRGEGVFKDVLVLDESILRKWSSKHLAVGLNLRGQFAGPISQDQVQLPSDCVKRFMARFKLTGIDSNILLCGRSELAVRIAGFEDVEQPLEVIANSIDEAMAVASVALFAVKDEATLALRRRSTLVIRSAGVLKHLKERRGLSLVISGDIEADSRDLQPGNRIIVCKALDNRTIDQPNVARDPGVLELGKYLTERRVEDGEKLAAMAGGAIASLQRLTGTNVGPAYLSAKGDEWQAIIFATLFGGWSEDEKTTSDATYRSLDVELIEKCLAPYFSFSAFRSHIATHTDRGADRPAADTLLKRLDRLVWVKAPVDALDCILNDLEAEHYQIFADALVAVFSGDGEEELVPGGPFSIRRTYSGALKTGLALNFCILAYRGALQGKSVGGRPIAVWVANLFQRLMSKVDFLEFISREEGLLGFFAEASPDVFLEALEECLQGNRLGMSEALSDVRDEFTIIPGHSANGLLWALMRLGWYPTCFARVVRALVGLHSHDPDKNSNYSPRPATVFRGLFMPFAPQTSLDWQERMRALDDIMDDLVDSDIDALFGLIEGGLPRTHLSQFSHSTPIFGPNRAPNISYGELYDAQDALFRKALLLVGGDAVRVGKLVRRLPDMSDEVFKEAMSLFEAVAENSSELERKAIWESVRELIVRHSRFPRAEWSMSEPRMRRLVRWKEVLEPTLEVQVEYLFSASWIEEVGDDSADGSALARRRSDAVHKLLDEQGASVIVNLCKSVAEPGHLGVSLASADLDLEALEKFILSSAKDITIPELFFRGLSQEAHRRFDDLWVDWLFLQATGGIHGPIAVAMLAALPINPKISQRISEDGFVPELRDLYWDSVNIYWMPGDEISKSDLDSLLKQDRHAELLRAFHFDLEKRDSELLRALVQGIYRKLAHDSERIQHHLDVSALMKLLSVCAKRQVFSLEELASFEFPLAKQLRWSKSAYPYAIHELAAKKPSVFVELLSFVYKSTKPFCENESQLSETEKSNRAELTYHVLDTLRHPELQEGKQPTTGALETWISEVVALAADYGLSEIASYKIGEVLALSSSETTDGLWPRNEVRKVIEAQANKDMLEGMRTKLFNERGVFSDGFTFYSEFAEKSEKAAEQLAAWPKTQKFLRNLAASDRHAAEDSRKRRHQEDAMPKLY